MSVTINRDALIIFPKQPLIDWVNSLDDENITDCPKLLTHDEGNVYLIPETHYHGEALELIKDNVTYFFEEELNSWYTDESLWPKELTWEMFQEWFHISIQSVVIDTLDEPLLKDNF